MPTPYAEHVGADDPVNILRRSLDDYRALAARMTPALWQQPWAAGKWTAREVMVHVAQWELIFGVRLRCALAVPNYAIEPLDQDPFMAIEAHAVDGPTAVAAFEGIRGMNLALAAALTTVERRHAVTHPERGQITVEDMLVTLAGHGVHHWKQLSGLAPS